MRIRGFPLLLIFASLFGGNLYAMNHYEMLGMLRRASTDEIRKRCMSATSVVDKKREIEALGSLKKVGARTQEEQREIEESNRKLDQKIAQLEKELDKILIPARMTNLKQATIAQINEACVTLQDPQKKSAYDRTLPAEGEEAKKPHVEAVFKGRTYYQYFIPSLPSDAKADEIGRLCAQERDRRKKEVEELRRKLPLDYQVQRRASVAVEQQAQFFEVKEQELKLTEEACTTLLDEKKRKEYDDRVAKGEFAAMSSSVTGFKANADVLLVGIVGEFLTKIPIPDVAFKLFHKDFALRNMKIVTAPSGISIRTGLGFTGTTFINKFGVKATVYVVRDYNRKLQYSLSLELPAHYKISDLFPEFKKLDKLSLPRGKFTVSTFDYFDPDGFSIKPGLNFSAFLELKGPLKLLGKLMDQSKKLKSVVARAEPIRFQGVIPRDPKTGGPAIKKVTFSAKIPLYIGVDLTKIPQMPDSVTDILKEVTTDDLDLVLTAPPILSFTVETGIRLVLTKQRDPIRLSGLGIIEPTSFSLGMRMRNMLELKWIALGNAGIQFDFDEALLPVAAVFGVPFTGIGINGQIEVGRRGDYRVTFKVAGGLRVASTKIPDLVFDVSALNLRFSDLIKLLVKVASHGGHESSVDLSKIPVMHLEYVRGAMALKDTKIAGKQYYAGFALEADALLFNRRAGFSFDLRQTMLSCSGSGYMSNIDVKIKDRTLFKLTGRPFSTKAGKMVEGPAIDFYFGFPPAGSQEAGARGQFRKALEGRFGMRGIFEIPDIALKQAVDFEWSGWNLRANFETIYAGFTVVFGIQIMLKSGMESMSSYDMLRREVTALIEQKDERDPTTASARESLSAADKLFAENKKDEARQKLEEARVSAQNAKRKEIAGGELVPGQLESGISYTEMLIAEIELLLNAAKKSTDVKTAQDIKNEASRTVQYWKGQTRKTLSKEEKISIEGQIISITNNLARVRDELKKVVSNEALGDFYKAKERTADPGKKFREMYVKFGFKGDFGKFLNEQAKPAIEKLKKKSSERLGKLNAEIGELSKKVSELGSSDEKVMQREIQRVQSKVTALQKEIDDLKKQREKAPKGKKGSFTAKIAAHRLDLSVKQVYLNGLLRPGKAVIKGVSTAVAAATQALHKAKLMKKAVEGMLGIFSKALAGLAKGAQIFHVTEAIGEWSWLDIKNLKAPRLISLIADLNIPGVPKIEVSLRNLQFDFKRIGYSTSLIAQQVLLGGIKVGGAAGGLGGMLGGKI